MPLATLTTKGQITLPKSVRERLGVGPGDRLLFRTTEDGQVVVEPATVDLRSLRGVLKAGRRRLTVEDMKRAVRTAGTR